MKTLGLTMVISLFVLKSSLAQFENTDVGARATALNGAFTSLSNNSLAVFYNPSGLGQLKFREGSFFYNPSVLGVSEISTAAFTFAEPMKFGTLGLGVKTFGFDLYRETSFVLSYGNNFRNKIFYGLNLNLYNLKIQNYNSANSFGVDFGAMAYITGFLKWGFFAKNLSGAKIGESKQRINQVYKTGFTVQTGNDFSLILEFEKDVRYPLSFKSGLEYNVIDFIDFRAGIGTQPASFSAGVGINYDMFQIDYALLKYNELGITNQGSVTINFGGNTARKLMREQLQDAFK